MAALTAVNLYISANILLVLAVALLAGIRTLSARLLHPIAYRQQLHFGRAVALAALLLPFVSLHSGHEKFLPQIAQVWSAPTMSDGATAVLNDHRVAVSWAHSGASMSLDLVSQAAAALFLAGLLLLLVRVAIDALATMRIIADAQPIRRHGRLRILASETVRVPFSFWLPGRYFIVVPSALLLCLDDLTMAIRHEGQHHRHLDTKLLYIHQLLKALFFWNPAVHRLEKYLRELQEFACDEALSGQRNISTQDYCHCLMRVAEAATRQRRRALIQAGMVSSGAGAILKRRIEAMLGPPTNHMRRSAVVATGAVALTLMTATALAFTSTIHDRRISADEAARLAAIAQRGTIFPIVVNDRVLEQLNLLLATPDGRAYLHASLARMQHNRELISEQIVLHGMPPELLAVPLVESGYRNLPRSNDPRRGAGLWMFIAPTAKRCGLTVDAGRDGRLDVLVALLSVLHLVQAKGFVINPQRSSLGRALLAALTFHVNWLEGHHGYLPGSWDILWSLSIEEVFYLLFPLICLCCRNQRWLVVPLLFLVVIGPLSRTALAGQEPWDEYAYLSCTDGIAIGCLAALVTARLRLAPSASRLLMALGTSAVLLIVVFRGFALPSGLHTVGLGISVLELGIALILIALSQGAGGTLLARGTSAIRMVGRSSYEIYLTHMLVILGLMPAIVDAKPQTSMIFAWYAALLVLSVALGWVVSNVYSEPLNKALRGTLRSA